MHTLDDCSRGFVKLFTANIAGVHGISDRRVDYICDKKRISILYYLWFYDYRNVLAGTSSATGVGAVAGAAACSRIYCAAVFPRKTFNVFIIITREQEYV